MLVFAYVFHCWHIIPRLRANATGAVLGLEPIHTENSVNICEALKIACEMKRLQGVRHVTTDDPSGCLLSALRQVCPGLEAVSLDPMHIAFVYETPAYRRKTPGSVFLRKILARAVGRRATSTMENQRVFTGDNCPEAYDREIRLRDMLQQGTMPELQSKKILLSIETLDITSRVQIVECLAALVRLFPDEVSQKATDGRTLREVCIRLLRRPDWNGC